MPNRSETDRIYDLERDMALIAKDVAQNQAFQESISKSLEKLTDISNNVTKMVAIHSSMLESHEKSVLDITSKMERMKDLENQRSNDLEKMFAKIETDVERRYSELSGRIEFNNASIEQIRRSNLEKKIEELQKTFDTRLTKLERYIWMFLGGGTLLGTIIPWAISALVKMF